MKKIKDVDLSMFGGMILYLLGNPKYKKWGVRDDYGDEVLARTFLEQDFMDNVFSDEDIEFVKQIYEDQTKES